MHEAFIVVVKKTFRYQNDFFYNHLYRKSTFRNIFMESGIMGHIETFEKQHFSKSALICPISAFPMSGIYASLRQVQISAL
jgi:hypothetical protein